MSARAPTCPPEPSGAGLSVFHPSRAYDTIGTKAAASLHELELRQWRVHLGLPILLALLAGCPSTTPARAPAPDASDASFSYDGAPTTPCQVAYDALNALHCGVSYSLLAKIDGNRGFLRTPDGGPLTCEGIAAVHTVQDAIALGIPCGQDGE